MTEYEQYTILNNISDSVLIIDKEYTVVFANDYLRNLLGVSAEELVGEKCYNLLHHSLFPCAGKSVPEKECSHKQIFETGNPMCVKHHHIMPDGSNRFFQISASPVKDENGAVARIICIAKDITKEEELQETVNKMFSEYRAILDNAPSSISYLDREMRIIRLNPLMEQLIGYTNDEVNGKHCYDIWGQYAHDETKNGKERICDACKAQDTLMDGRTYSYERKIRDRYIEVITSPVKDNDGHIIGSLECGLDITERKQNEKTLRLYERIIATSQDLMAFVDKNYVYMAVNDAYCDAHKKKREEIIGHSVADLLGRDVFNAKLKTHLDKALSGKRVQYESWLEFPDIGKRHMEINYCPYHEKDGNISGVAANVRDITARKQAEEELEAVKTRLRKLTAHLQEIGEQERTAIAREIHDDLGQVLTALKMDLGWIEKRLTAGCRKTIGLKLETMREMIDGSVRGLKDLCTRLRPGILDDLGILAAVEWYVNAFQVRSGIPCNLTMPRESISVDTASSTVIYRILQEALNNVFRHAEASSIDISLTGREGKLIVEVVDDGMGISEKSINSFKSFGLMGMNERATAVGGTFRVGKRQDGVRGTHLEAVIPLGTDSAESAESQPSNFI